MTVNPTEGNGASQQPGTAFPLLLCRREQSHSVSLHLLLQLHFPDSGRKGRIRHHIC